MKQYELFRICHNLSYVKEQKAQKFYILIMMKILGKKYLVLMVSQAASSTPGRQHQILGSQ